MSITGVILAAGLSAVAIWLLAVLPSLHPAQLWTVVWAIAVALYAARLLPYRDLSWATVAVIAGATAAFSAGAIAADGE